MSETTSKLRQDLRQAADAHRQCVDALLGERGPLVRGSFGARSRVCGHPNCKCAKGELHQSKYLTASDSGRVRQVHVPAQDEVRVAEGVERARRFRAAQAELAGLAKRQLELADRLGQSLTVPYPKDHPFPVPQHRGPPPRKRGRPSR
jgi:hypothetical protein